jgi:hypothetical protein
MPDDAAINDAVARRVSCLQPLAPLMPDGSIESVEQFLRAQGASDVDLLAHRRRMIVIRDVNNGHAVFASSCREPQARQWSGLRSDEQDIRASRLEVCFGFAGCGGDHTTVAAGPQGLAPVRYDERIVTEQDYKGLLRQRRSCHANIEDMASARVVPSGLLLSF